MKTIKQIKKEKNLWYFDIDKPWFKPGQMFKLCFENPQNKNEISILPAIILNTHIWHLTPPTHNVGFWTRWISGGVSGMLVLDSMMPGRYCKKDSNDITPELIDFFKDLEIPEYDLKPRSLFYVKEISKTERELIYPFCS